MRSGSAVDVAGRVHGEKPEPAPSATRHSPAEARPNVLLVVIDTLGADHVDGLPPGTRATPEMDRLAAGGVAFQRAYSTAPWTQPAVASLMTSKMPSSHGVLRLMDSVPRDQRTLPEHFHAHGFRTAAIVSHILVGRRFGWGKGFDAFDESPVGTTVRSRPTSQRRRIRELSISRGALLPVLHYFDPHYVYNHHPAFDRTSGYKGRCARDGHWPCSTRARGCVTRTSATSWLTARKSRLPTPSSAACSPPCARSASSGTPWSW